MRFPNLQLSKVEIDAHRAIEHKLLGRFHRLFYERYGLTPEIKCSGSTEKGTALPEQYFGVDFDISVRADKKTLEKIAYVSDIFEGCQLFSMDFFENASKYFDSIYFAGHRVSGKISGEDFDFSIADEKKDSWKWEYNGSKYLQLSGQQIESAKKLKFFLKTFNVSGSEIYGIVGPAVELLAFHHVSFEEIFNKLKKFVPMDETPANLFNTVRFPKEFYDLFPPSEDSIHRGLIESFRYTSPNAFNRLVEAISASTLNKDSFISNHKPNFNYSRVLNMDNRRLVTYLLGRCLQQEDPMHLDLLTERNGNLCLYASANTRQIKHMDRIVDLIQQSQDSPEINLRRMPKEINDDIISKLNGADPFNYVFFIGHPTMPLQKGSTYIPFDFLIRSDAYRLVTIMEAGQNGIK